MLDYIHNGTPALRGLVFGVRASASGNGLADFDELEQVVRIESADDGWIIIRSSHTVLEQKQRLCECKPPERDIFHAF